MEIKLKAYKSHSFPERFVPPAETKAVSSLREASQVARAWIERFELGASNVGALKVYEGKKHVALISYNGRIWTTEKDWQKRKEISIAEEAKQ